MAYTNLLFYFIWATLVLQGVSGEIFVSRRELHKHYVSRRGMLLQETSTKSTMNKNSRTRSTVGSVMPTCTFNECKGCKYKCSPKQVPVEGNDPINSVYRYRCICHRLYECKYLHMGSCLNVAHNKSMEYHMKMQV